MSRLWQSDNYFDRDLEAWPFSDGKIYESTHRDDMFSNDMFYTVLLDIKSLLHLNTCELGWMRVFFVIFFVSTIKIKRTSKFYLNCTRIHHHLHPLIIFLFVFKSENLLKSDLSNWNMNSVQTKLACADSHLRPIWDWSSFWFFPLILCRF